MDHEEREELIFICSMRTNYTEDCLAKMSDEELIQVYNRTLDTTADGR